MPEVSAATRSKVRERAANRCEYCGVHESIVFHQHQIDHILSVKHGGGSELDNLALSCILCNRYKGSDLASVDQETGTLAPLFHPRKQIWDHHFRASAGRIQGLTPTGRATERLLQFNRLDRVRERAGTGRS